MKLAVIEVFAIVAALAYASQNVLRDIFDGAEGVTSPLIESAIPGKGPSMLEGHATAVNPEYHDRYF